VTDNVITAPGLRVHTIPLVGADAIQCAMRDAAIGIVDPKAPGDEYRFGVVCHPCQRLVVAWENVRAASNLELRGLTRFGFDRNITFPDFLEIATTDWDKHPWVRKQSLFLGPHEFDRLVRFETLPAAWEKLRRNFPSLHRLGKLAPLRSDYLDLYPRIYRRRCEYIFADDLERYESAVTARLRKKADA